MAVIAIFIANRIPSDELDWNKISEHFITTLNGRISTLRLDDNYRIMDTIPPDIGKLTELIVLSIDDSRIKYLPAEIGNLTKLQKLYLSQNKIRVLPSTIGNLTELRHLSLSDEIELRSLPPEIKLLTKLEYLDIESENLKSLPKEIVSLIYLKYFRIEASLLTNLSFDIGKLSNLEKLEIRCPLINLDSLQEAIYTLGNLRSLGIGRSKITRISGEIKKLKELYSLRLNNNNISCLTPEIGNLSKLKILKVRGNNIQNLPIEIINLKPDTGCDFAYNYLNEKELSDDVVHWLNTFDPDWRRTQKKTGVKHSEMKNSKSAVLSYNFRTNVVTYQLNQSSKISLKLFDVSGKGKYVFVDNIIGSGSNKCDLNTIKSSLCDGTYFLILNVYNGLTYTSHNKKIVYLQ
jgi:Leucine-rich repeat (LRR) protein